VDSAARSLDLERHGKADCLRLGRSIARSVRDSTLRPLYPVRRKNIQDPDSRRLGLVHQMAAVDDAHRG
jgi:hypothetical protein